MHVERSQVVTLPIDVAFAVMAIRERQPLPRRLGQIHYLDDAREPALGVRVECKPRFLWRIIIEYTSYQPPHKAVMQVVQGPWVVPHAACGLGFSAVPTGTEVTVRYAVRVRPAFIRPMARPLIQRLLAKAADRYLTSYAAWCANEAVVRAAHEALSESSPSNDAPH